MGIIDMIKSTYQQNRQNLQEYESRGLDVIPDTDEARRYCISKVKGQMLSAMVGPMVFALLAWAVALYLLYDPEEGFRSIMDFGTGGRIAFFACCIGVPVVAALLYFPHLGSISAGKFELYGGMCLSVRNGDKDKRGTHYDAKMNGVWLASDSFALRHVGAGVYYYILRVGTRKKPVYFFVRTNADVAASRTGDFYPND